MIDNVLQFIFPKRCVICDCILPFGNTINDKYICKNCSDKIKFIKSPTCKKCGAMINDVYETFCERCKLSFRENYDFGFGLCKYNNAVKKSLHKIKYSGRKEYLDFYGYLISKKYHKVFQKLDVDCFVPVPIHKKRKSKRGYNQSYILANHISNYLLQYNINIPIATNLIYRTKNTKVLNKLNNNERSFELQNAFFAIKNTGIKSVVLVDDIYTTGSTIDAIAKTLKGAGIKSVYFVTIAVVDNI